MAGVRSALMGWAARHPFAAAWLVTLAVLVVRDLDAIDLPAYHDARLHWEVATSLHRRPWFPFVVELDPGHPPLVSWVLAIAWWLPVPRIAVMHVLIWSAAGAFIAALFEIGRRAFGAGVGLAAALLLAFHPVVAAQTLQMNLDLFVAAFAMIALLGAVRGQPLVLAIGCSGAAMTKLNGLFVLAPFLLWVAGRCWRDRSWLHPRRLLSALWPMGIALGIFVAYHGVKRAVTGHLFVTAEFVDDNLRFVAGPAEYVTRFEHALRQTLGFNNGNLWALMAMLAALALVVLAIPRQRLLEHLADAPANVDDGDGRFWRPLSPGETLALLWLMAFSQIALWSLRRYLALVRYFVVAYPAIYLTLAAAVGMIVSRRRNLVLAAVTLPLVATFYLRGHPARVARLPAALRMHLVVPPPGVPTNHENNREVVDQIELVGRVARELEQKLPPGTPIAAAWPFDGYLSDPTHGMVTRPFPISMADPQVLLEFSTRHPGRDARGIPVRAGFRIDSVHRSGRIWIAVLVRERS